MTSKLDDPEVIAALQAGIAHHDAVAGPDGLTPAQVRDELAEFQTLAQLRGLSRDDLEVLYTYGFGLISAGSHQQAEDTFMQLCLLDPLEAKNHYCLGVVRQMRGDWRAAKDDFLRFLALDATNPEGYLRLGECLRALGDTEGAGDCARAALAHARKGRGPEDAVQQAEKALATLT